MIADEKLRDTIADALSNNGWSVGGYGDDYREAADEVADELHKVWRGHVADWHLVRAAATLPGGAPWPCRCDDNLPDDTLCDGSKRYADMALREALFTRAPEREPMPATSILEMLRRKPRELHLTPRLACWCGGDVGPREPGDGQGLGCLLNIMHDYRGGAAAIDTVEQLDTLPEGTKIREVAEGVTWQKERVSWRCIAGFVPGLGQPLLPAEVVE